MEQPGIVFPIDTDPKASTASREEIIRRAEAEGLVVMGGHFPPPTAGRMVRVEQKLRWQWVGAEVAG
jgi:hypothetical protein